MATRELLPDVIRWVKFSGAVWTRDGFYYSGYDEPKQSEALVAQNRFQKIFFHKLGTEQSADRLIYEDRAHPLRYVSAEVSKDDRHLFVFATEGTSGNEVLWADLSKGAPNSRYCSPASLTIMLWFTRATAAPSSTRTRALLATGWCRRTSTEPNRS